MSNEQLTRTVVRPVHNQKKGGPIMVQILNAAPAQPKRRHPNLLLHCGASAVELDQVARVNTPRATSTWHPIPHHQLIETVQRTLAATNLTIGTLRGTLTSEATIARMLIPMKMG
jgi:hypothetical protein